LEADSVSPAVHDETHILVYLSKMLIPRSEAIQVEQG